MEDEKEVDTKATTVDFDLPELEEGPKATGVRISIGGSVCESCEG